LNDLERMKLEEELYAHELAENAVTLGEHLPLFIRASWPIIEPATRYLHNWHIDAISDYLKACRARDIKRLIINIPPRYMKSIIVTVNFPVWWWTEQPEERFVFASYSDSLSKKHSIDRRTIIESGWYQERWGSKVRLRSDQNEKREFQNERRGHMIATSVGGSVTGKGGNVIIIDDPQDPEAADSEVQRLQAQDFIEGTLSTRLDDKKNGVIIIVMQRLNEKDLTGHELAKQGAGWEHLCLPGRAEAKTTISLPSSKKKLTREVGDVLWPEREGERELQIQEIAMTPLRFAGQYQQRPAPAEGNLIKRTWWQYYDVAPALFDEVVDSWDCSFKDTDGSDYVCGQKWGRVGSAFYLLALIRQRMNEPETEIAILNMRSQKPEPFAVLVEEAANGHAVIQRFKKKITNCIAIPPTGSKQSRASAASPIAHAGNCFLPNPEKHNVPWVNVFIEELAVFPNGENDDQVDSWSQAINYMMQKLGGIFDWLLEKKKAQDEERKKRENDPKFGRYIVNAN
jgi:predicted phage terminase large subunit-like protein